MDGAFPIGQDLLQRHEPPHSTEAEQALLGAMILDARSFDTATETVQAEHMYHEAHAAIFRTLVDLKDRHRATDLVSVRAAMARSEALEEAGGADYLNSIIANVVSLANTPDYAKRVRDLWMQRALRPVLDDAAHRVSDPSSSTPVLDVIEALESGVAKIAEVAEDAVAGQTIWTPAETVAAYRNAPDRGVRTGLGALDELTHGLHPNQLIVVGGRPGTGKSDFMLNISRGISQNRGRILLFSLEMDAEQLGERFARWPVRAPESMTIDTRPNMTIQRIRSLARRHKRRQGLDVIVIDYLQLIRAGQAERRDIAIGDMTRGLKLLAKELEVTVVLLAQLNRELEHRPDMRPRKSDLRESGNIEQDADAIWLLYDPSVVFSERPKKKRDESDGDHYDRCAKWEEQKLRAEQTLEVIVDKQRQRARGSAFLYYSRAHSWIADQDAPGPYSPAWSQGDA